MTEEYNEAPAESTAEHIAPIITPLTSLRNAGCKVINEYLPNYVEGADQAEVFGITKEQFERAFDLEWIRRGRPENAVVAALYVENERLRAELNRVGVMIDSACRGSKRQDEPHNLTNRLDMVRKLAKPDVDAVVYADINKPLYEFEKLKKLVQGKGKI